MAMAMGLPPNASAERWRAGFILEARGTWLPVVSVGGPQLTYTTLQPEVMSNTTINPAGLKAMHPHQATAERWNWKLGQVLDKVPMHGQLSAVG